MERNIHVSLARTRLNASHPTRHRANLAQGAPEGKCGARYQRSRFGSRKCARLCGTRHASIAPQADVVRKEHSSRQGRTMRRAVALAAAIVLGLATIEATRAQAPAEDYPQRTVTFLCPFPAGGGTDILTRLLAHELQDKLKRPVVVENRPGAGTIVAAQAAARAAPDGHTILLAPVTTLAMGPSVHKSLPYDTVKDFAPIGLVGSSQFALIANAKLGVGTLPELIAFIKSKNGQLSYA